MPYVEVSRYFNETDVIEKLSSHNLMAPVSEQASTRIGVQTLAKDFFVISREMAEEHAIEDDYLRPMIHSIRTVERLTIEEDTSPYHYLFCCNNSKLELIGTRALGYIELGEATPVKIRGKNLTVIGYHNKERIRKDFRTYWYDLETEIQRRGIASILIPRLIYQNLDLVWNRAGYVPGELFIEFTPHEDKAEDTEVYLAILSSSVAEVIDIIPIYGSMCLDRQGGYTCDCDMRTSETKRIESWI